MARLKKATTHKQTHIMNSMHTLSTLHIISAPALAAPLAVLLLASINALLDIGGQASSNAITIAKSALCAALLALAAVLVVGPFKLATVEVSGFVLSLTFGLLPAALILIASFTSLLIAKGTNSHHAADSAKDSIARWNIAGLFLVTAMILSGNAVTIAAACIIAGFGVLKLQAASPEMLGALTTGSMNTPA
jgi:hypothetical protein